MTDEIEMARLQTQAVYERQARHWDENRSRSLYEKPWLDKFIARLPAKSSVLDLGCGSGDPVAHYFMAAGFDVVGVDYSAAMIELARAKYAKARWYVQDMRSLGVNGLFDGIYSWDGLFHLCVDEQRALIPDLANRVRDGGAILLTVGTGEGEVTGTVGGEAVYHASLDPEDYRALFIDHGFQDVTYTAEDPACQGRSVVLATGKVTV